MERTHETYSVACELHQNHHYYDAISRAHYSMFYAAKAVLLTKDVITRTHRGKSHNSISILYEGRIRREDMELFRQHRSQNPLSPSGVPVTEGCCTG
ncbi:HEPN domain-containing protein [Methanospirillum sp.]